MSHSSATADPRFDTIQAPGQFSAHADGPVLYAPVSADGILVGYVWASADDTAAGFVPRPDAGDASHASHQMWIGRLRQARAASSSPAALIGQDTGLGPDGLRTAASLADLQALTDQD